jgi:hypothetical protein
MELLYSREWRASPEKQSGENPTWEPDMVVLPVNTEGPEFKASLGSTAERQPEASKYKTQRGQ